MKPLSSLFAAITLLLTGTLPAQVPHLLSHQGRVAVNGVNFDGTGLFKFALVNANGATTYWSNDGTSTAGSQPAAAVSLPVTKGLYSLLLGDIALTNMAAVPVTVFTNADVRLRVWFNNGALGFQQLTPDQRLAPNGYLADGAVTASKLAAGAVSQLSAPDGSPLAALQVNADGLVGIGTATPAAGLHIASSGTVQTMELASLRKNGSGGYTALQGAWGVACQGNLAAVAAYNDGGLTLLDLTDPAAPVLRWQVRDGEGGYDFLSGAWKVAMKPGLLAVAASSDNAVTLINVADPANPVKLAELRDGVGGYNGLAGAGSIALSGNLLAVGSYSEGTVTLVDITNPAAPVKRAEITNGAGGYTRLAAIEGIALSGNLLAIGSNGEGVTLVDVSAPAAPVKRAELVKGTAGYEALGRTTGLAISGGLLAVASQNMDALTLVDVSNPASPVRRAVLQQNVNTTALSSVVAVAFSGTQMLTAGDGAAAVWDVSNAASPVELGAARQGVGGFQSIGDPWGAAFAGGSMVVTSTSGEVSVLRLSSHASSLTTTGWAGIGTAKPEVPLHVLGNVRVDAASWIEFNTSHFEAGYLTEAFGEGSTALGFRTTAGGAFSTAMGYNSNALSDYSVAIGRNALAMQESAVALGGGARAGGVGSVALGAATAAGNYSTAMGGATAYGDYATAAGQYSNAFGHSSTALGYGNMAMGAGSFAAGTSANAEHGNTFVWSAGTPDGSFSSTAANQFLIQAGGGVGINTNNPNGAALAVNGNINFTGSLTGSGSGLTNLNAANLAGSVPAAALTSVPAASLTGAVPASALTSVPVASLTGTITDAQLPATVALRNASNSFTANQSIAGNLTVTGSVAMGSGNSAAGFAAVALGGSSQASGNYSMAIGNGATASAGNAIAMGMSTTAAHTGSFVWADGLSTPFSTTQPNQFIIRAASGVGIGTNSPGAMLQVGDANVPGSQGMIRLGSRSGTTNLYNTWDIGVFKHDTNYLGRYFSFNIDNPGLGTQPEMTIRWDNGHTGIGTENPATKLHVYSADNPTVMRIQSAGAPGFGRLEFVSNPQFDNNEWRPSYIQSTDAGGFTGGLSFVVNGTGAANKFAELETMRIQNGRVGIGTNNPSTALQVIGTVTATAFNPPSDRNLKENFEPVNAQEVLEKVAAMPVSRWNFIGDPDTAHIGPMAQDFHAAFATGTDDKHIATVDADGVALAAIKGLNEKLKEKEAEITTLKKQHQTMEQRLAALEELVLSRKAAGARPKR